MVSFLELEREVFFRGEIKRIIEEQAANGGPSKSLIGKHLSPAYLSEVLNGKKPLPFMLGLELFFLARLSQYDHFDSNDIRAISKIHDLVLEDDEIEEELVEMEKLISFFVADSLLEIAEGHAKWPDDAFPLVKRKSSIRKRVGQGRIGSSTKNVFGELARAWTLRLQKKYGGRQNG